MWKILSHFLLYAPKYIPYEVTPLMNHDVCDRCKDCWLAYMKFTVSLTVQDLISSRFFYTSPDSTLSDTSTGVGVLGCWGEGEGGTPTRKWEEGDNTLVVLQAGGVGKGVEEQKIGGKSKIKTTRKFCSVADLTYLLR